MSKNISYKASVPDRKPEKSVSADGDAFSFEYWDESAFLGRRREWTELLKQSYCDHLFMSWEWHKSWWLQHKTDRSVLCIIAFYKADELFALAPMYLDEDTYIKGLLPVRRLQFIGKRFRGISGIRAEYMSFIIQKDLSGFELPLFIVKTICEDSRWDELVLEDMATDELTYEVISSSLSKKGCRYRLESSGPTYVVDCTKSFNDYLAGLGKNTRLRLYNRRKILEQTGTVSIEYMNETNKNEFFETINMWHRQRWGKPAFQNQAQQFLSSVFTLEPSPMSLDHSSLLKLNDRPISVLINALVNGRLYNIQQGYVEDFDKRISVGTLHLGYQIEAAFKDKNILSFDLLEGQGKKSNYKSRLAREEVILESTRWSRSLMLKGLFAVYDKLLRSKVPRRKLVN